MKYLLIFLLLFISSHNSHADLYKMKTGNDYIEHCHNIAFGRSYTNDPLLAGKTGFCMGFIEAIGQSSGIRNEFCKPDYVTKGEIVKYIYDYIRTNNLFHKAMDASVINEILTNKYPCQENEKLSNKLFKNSDLSPKKSLFKY